MSADFSKVLYKTLETHMEKQVGPEERKKLTSKQWRAFMDDVMLNFSRALVAIVVQVSTQHVQAQKEAQEKAKAEMDAAVAAGVVSSGQAHGEEAESFPTEDHLKAEG